MQIYVHRNNQQLGPFTEEELKAQIASGAISLQDPVWWQGQANWLPLNQTTLAATLAPGVPVPPSIPGAVAPSILLPASEKTSNLALWSLIFGIGSLFCGILFIPAIALGHMGLAETNKNPAIKGRGMALAGTIIGYALLAFYLLLVIAVSAFVALGHSIKDPLKILNAQTQAAASEDDADSTQSTNSADQSTNDAPSTDSSDSSTNSAPSSNP